MSRQEERRAIALTLAKQHGRDIPSVVDWGEAQELQKQFDAMDAVQAVRKAAGVKYPEHDKMHKIKQDSSVIGEFLEDCGYTLCNWNDSEHGYVPVNKDIDQILADYFTIDLKKIEQEKKQMLDEVRAGNKAEREMHQ